MPQWAQWVTLAIAAIGAVLGIMNTWRTILREKPRVEVRPLWFATQDLGGGKYRPFSSRLAKTFEKGGAGMFGVEAINRGFVPVHIREFGVCPPGHYLLTRFQRYKEPAGRLPFSTDARQNVDFPVTLEPGRRVSVAMPGAAIYAPDFANAGCVYIYTEDERLFVGRSELLTAIVRHSRNPEG